MNDELERRLRRDLRQVDAARLPGAEVIDAGVRRSDHRRTVRRRAAMASVSVVLVTVAAAGIWQAADRGQLTSNTSALQSTPAPSTDPPGTNPPPTVTPTVTPGTAQSVPVESVDPATGGWSAIPVDPRGPVVGAQVVWTGSEAIAIGGADQAGNSVDEVAAYNPASGQWRTVTATPSPLMWPLTVWTGSEVLAIGWSDDVLNTRAATLHIAAGRWSLGAVMPFGFKAFSQTPHVWTGTELLLWADTPVAYNPSTDTWRTLADAPIDRRLEATSVWTGTEWIVWGGLALVDNDTRADGAAYDLATDTWRTLPPAPLSRRIADGAWTGSEVLITAGRSGDGNGVMAFSDGAAYDPSTDTWRSLADGPAHPGFQPIWTGDRLILFAKGGAVLYDPVTDRWTDFQADAPDHDDSSAVWTGSVALLLGSYQGSTGGATFTPPLG